MKYPYLALLFISNLVFADQIKLINNDQLSGKFVSYAAGLCVFDTEYSGIITLSTQKIASIQIDDTIEATLKTGEKIVGHLSAYDNQAMTISSEIFGSIALKSEAITDIQRRSLAKTPVSNKEAESTFGEKEAEPPLNFLKDSTVLLKDGNTDIDLSFRYKRQRNSYAMFGAPTLENANTTARMLEAALSIRRGFGNGLEGWIRLPYSYTEVENVSGNDYVMNDNKLKMSDIQFGVQYLLAPEKQGVPSISLSFKASAPTGSRNYYAAPNDWLNFSSNGSGHWMLSPGIDFVKTIDPVVFFGGISYEHFMSSTIDGHIYEPGKGVSTYAGVGFALNDRVSLSTRLRLAYYDNMSYDHVKMQGSSYEPMDLGFSATYRTKDNLIVMPTVIFGLNSDAGSPGLVLSLSKRY
jgi:small nuclear ribonucleoprotein (snRNP)-like protein